MKENLIQIKLLGVTFSQVQAGAYALILAEENGSRRIPIIVGTPEAQSIAIFLEGLTPPRPLTHDLIVNFAEKLYLNLEAAYIYKYEDGIFYSSLIYKQTNGAEITLDSRTSDAIAIAIRSHAPIFITEEIMQSVSVVMDETSMLLDDMEDNEILAEPINTSYDDMSLDELKVVLDNAISSEDYEKASQIRDIINKMK